MKSCLILLVSLIGCAHMQPVAHTAKQPHIFEFIGPVENVAYNADPNFPCAIAMGSDDIHSEQGKHFFQICQSLAACEFAERSRKEGSNVRLVGVAAGEGTGQVLRIEYADSEAKSEMKIQIQQAPAETEHDEHNQPPSHMYL